MQLVLITTNQHFCSRTHRSNSVRQEKSGDEYDKDLENGDILNNKDKHKLGKYAIPEFVSEEQTASNSAKMKKAAKGKTDQ